MEGGKGRKGKSWKERREEKRGKPNLTLVHVGAFGHPLRGGRGNCGRGERCVHVTVGRGVRGRGEVRVLCPERRRARRAPSPGPSVKGPARARRGGAEELVWRRRANGVGGIPAARVAGHCWGISMALGARTNWRREGSREKRRRRRGGGGGRVSPRERTKVLPFCDRSVPWWHALALWHPSLTWRGVVPVRVSGGGGGLREVNEGKGGRGGGGSTTCVRVNGDVCVVRRGRKDGS